MKKTTKREFTAWILLPINKKLKTDKVLKSSSARICGSRKTLESLPYEESFYNSSKVKVIEL